MQRSTSTSSSEPRSFARDERAVSEAVGYAITFGILSIVLVASLSAFNRAQEDAEDRVVALRASSAAQRVATTIVEVSVLAQGEDLQVYRRDIVLADQFEGRDYTVSIGDDNDSVVVHAQGLPAPVVEPLFGAVSGPQMTFCAMEPMPGGALRITYEASAGGPGVVCMQEVS